MILECTYVVGSSYHFCEESIRFYDWIFANLIYLDERLAAQENCKRVTPGCCHSRERASRVQGKSLVKADAVAVQFCAVFNCSLGQHQVVRVRYRLQQVLELRDVQRNTCEFVLPQIFVYYRQLVIRPWANRQLPDPFCNCCCHFGNALVPERHKIRRPSQRELNVINGCVNFLDNLCLILKRLVLKFC